MENNKPAVQGTPNNTIKAFLGRDDVKAKFTEILGNRSAAFITSVLSAVNSNELLKNSKPESVYMSALMAATLDLPINPNLGFAYIIPYNQKDSATGNYQQVAQFQIGYKGILQLAQRSGQFKFINSSDVREGEIKHHNRLTGEIEFNWEPDTAKRILLPVVGYVSYFKLLNGFENTFYMTNDEIKLHGSKYSKTYKNQYGLWTTDFNGMATKTVIKLNLSKFAPLSVESQLSRAIQADQAVINDVDTMDLDYVDVPVEVLNEAAGTAATNGAKDKADKGKKMVAPDDAAKTQEKLDNLKSGNKEVETGDPGKLV